jgi:hypothetical protein
MITLLLIELAILLLISWASEYENDIGATLLAVGGVTAAFFFTGTNPIDFVRDNLTNIVFFVLGWFAIGAGWSILKWSMWTGSKKIQDEIRENWAIYNKTYPENTREDFNKNSYYNVTDLGKNYGKLVRWIVFWPASVLWSLTYRAVRKIANWVYDALERVFASIAKSQVDRALKDA